MNNSVCVDCYFGLLKEASGRQVVILRDSGALLLFAFKYSIKFKMGQIFGKQSVSIENYN